VLVLDGVLDLAPLPYVTMLWALPTPCHTFVVVKLDLRNCLIELAIMNREEYDLPFKSYSC
jgi:hypothetical protein